jgi:hypothetical protein
MDEPRTFEQDAACGPVHARPAKLSYLEHGRPPDGNDAALLGLEARFQTIAAELRAACVANHGGEPENPATLEQVEAILSRLEPIEQAIMMTEAETVVGLAVKARHAAYVLSDYWDDQIERSDWDRLTVRLLIEAVCHVARVPHPLTTDSGSGV